MHAKPTYGTNHTPTPTITGTPYQQQLGDYYTDSLLFSSSANETGAAGKQRPASLPDAVDVSGRIEETTGPALCAERSFLWSNIMLVTSPRRFNTRAWESEEPFVLQTGQIMGSLGGAFSKHLRFHTQLASSQCL